MDVEGGAIAGRGKPRPYRHFASQDAHGDFFALGGELRLVVGSATWREHEQLRSWRSGST